MSYPGWASLCLPTPDLEASKRFYLVAGFDLISEIPGKRAILASGAFRLALMSFLEKPLLNIRGGDVGETFETVRSASPAAPGEVAHYTREELDADADGNCWATRDPSGFEVLFDTNALEVGPGFIESRSQEVLRAAADELERLGASPLAVEKIRGEVLPLLSTPT